MRAALTVLALAATSAASDPVLHLPIDCTLGKTCHIQQFVDRDPGSGARDFRCGTLSYEGHKGTDFALPSLAAMQAGVNVKAAAAGTVRATRDGMEDRRFNAATDAAVAGRECGNGVLIVHEDGWETQYCHMKRGSIRVKSGDTVQPGDVLGQVGLSGQTEFPHLHLSVRHDGQVVDPFDPKDPSQCGDPAKTLWQTPIPYQPGALIAVGFSDHVPTYEAIQAGTAAQDTLVGKAKGLVLFGYAFGGLAGDVIRLTIHGPDGEVINHETTLEKNQAQLFRAAGRKLTAARWPAGQYTGTAELRRNGTVISSKSIQIDMP